MQLKNISIIRNWPSKNQWKKVFGVLTKKERVALFVLLGLFLGSAVSLAVISYSKNTEVQPAVGGRYIEGVVGSPRFINPIYAQTNDVDRDLVEIIFSGLMKYDEQGKIVPDLAEEVKIEEDGKTYEVYLKENVFWHDGEKLTADDVIFTLQTIQNPDYKSPLRGNYLGIKVEKIENGEAASGLRFKLNNPYAGFLERLTFKIIPKHIWQDISPQNFLLINYNLKPIGSGPYQFKELRQDGSNSITSLGLTRFKNYYSDSKPYLKEIDFRFFKSEEDLVSSARRGGVDGFSLTSPSNFNFFEKSGFNEYSPSLPRYFAVFFNPDKSNFLIEDEIRQALNYATDKQEIVNNVLLGRARVVDSPILPEIYGFQAPASIYEFNPERAKMLLEEAGLEKNDEGKWIKAIKEKITEFKSELKLDSRGSEVTGLQTCLARDQAVYPEGKITGYFGSQTKAAVIRFQEKYSEDILEPWGFKKGTGIVSRTTRAKLNEICLKPEKVTPLKFSLVTVEDPVLKEVASLIKKQWENLGIEVEIQAYPVSQLESEIIKPRNYEILLFGEVLEAIPDPFPFWHSSQVRDPGLNLAKYENKKVDKLLEEARTTLDTDIRTQKYQEFQDILIEDCPGLFLYRPDYVYFVSDKIKGMDTKIIADPSKRFSGIENWYAKTKRAWK